MSDYYNLEKTAEILKLTPAEVNRLREQGEIQGFRDGSNWKFKKEGIDNYYVTMTQKKGNSPFGVIGEEEDLLTSEDEQELPTMMADSASFAQFGDGLLSLDGTPGVDSASDANLDDGLTMFGDMGDSDDLSLSDSPIPLEEKEKKIEIFGIMGENDSSGTNDISDSGLNLGGDSGISIIGGSGSGVDLAGSDKIFDDDDVVIGGSSSGLNLGGDSGISLLDAAAESGFSLGAAAGGSDAILELAPDDDILALIDEDVDPDTATVLGTEDDFQLQADDELFMTDDSESSSQVIAIEGDLADNIEDFAFTDELGESSIDSSPLSDVGSVDSSAFSGAGADNSFGGFGGDDNLFGGADAMDMGGAEAAVPGFGVEAASAAGVPVAKTSGIIEPKFTGLSVTALLIIVLIMFVGSSLMFELIRCIWSWSEPLTINSSILGLFGK